MTTVRYQACVIRTARFVHCTKVDFYCEEKLHKDKAGALKVQQDALDLKVKEGYVLIAKDTIRKDKVVLNFFVKRVRVIK